MATSVEVSRDEEIKSKTAAQDAYARGDVEASIAEHKKPASAEDHAGGASEYVKAIVFGGLDGIITTFAVVTAAAGADADWKTVLVFGFANMVGDAFSMGFGECLSGHAERTVALSERKREEWEVAHNIEGEIEEMIELYEQKGFPKEDAAEIVSIISKDPKLFVDIMMVEELGLLVDVEDVTGPFKQGLVMFLAFFFFGFFSMIPYLSGKGRGLDYIFAISCALTGVAMLTLGSAKGYLTAQSIPGTAIIMLCNGIVAGGASYGIGVLVTYIVTGTPSVKSDV